MGDITCIPTEEGFCYLAGVADACSRRILGWSVAAHLRAELLPRRAAGGALTREPRELDGAVFQLRPRLPVHRGGLPGAAASSASSMGAVGDC